MKLIIFISIFLGLLASSFAVPAASGLPYGLSAVRSVTELPYPVSKMTFLGTLGGHDVQLNGSIEEIHSQMTVLHPEFDPDALLAAKKLAIRDTGSELIESELEGRSKSNMICCNPGSWGADPGRIEQGIDYLDHFNGLCGVPARTCVRISCSWGSAIYLCNDNYYGITPTCPYMASYAQDILNTCPMYSWTVQTSYCGQEFDTDSYNIIVRGDNC
ncbi:uncharacterized protein LY89DRAFT_720237 [Mollisia scopiformis]|uniref:Uncharacterized protein n=1 Tax=Mollisia scopiformis TaxID=149040 RepID=A0A194X4L3_MOLSC|nr:uncharacterized protein LY89DRAFT_720237 [Mollisia scopiformis]KUJ14762.1 hypothetical protein LY89DRAFT_720237 [Mollisia scopiformis]